MASFSVSRKSCYFKTAEDCFVWSKIWNDFPPEITDEAFLFLNRLPSCVAAAGGHFEYLLNTALSGQLTFSYTYILLANRHCSDIRQKERMLWIQVRYLLLVSNRCYCVSINFIT